MEMAEKTRNWTVVTLVWMTVSTLFFSAFWYIWCLVSDKIPAPKVPILQLAVSRSWDMAVAPIFVLIFCQLYRWAEKQDGKIRIRNLAEAEWEELEFALSWQLPEKKSELLIELFFGLIAGLISAVIPSSLFFIIILACMFPILITWMTAGLSAWLVFWLGFSFIIGLFWFGLLLGLGIFLIMASPRFLVIALGTIYRKLKRWCGR